MKYFGRYILRNQFLVAMLVLVAGWAFLRVISIMFVFFIAFIIMSSLSPFVEFLESKKIPQFFAILIPYILILAGIILLVLPMIPLFSAQIQSLFTNFPRFFDKPLYLLGINVDLPQLRNQFAGQISSFGGNLITYTTNLFDGFILLVASIVMSVYLLFYKRDLEKMLVELCPKHLKQTTRITFEEILKRLGSWLRGQIILSLAVGVLVWIGLVIIGIPYAFPLAVFAGLMEIVPTIGPLVSALPGILLGLTISPVMAGFALLMYIIVQQIENHILVPQVMQRAVDLNPIVTILTILVSLKFFGLLGALLSVPFLALLLIIFTNFKEEELS